jgi:hypothetical protein
MLSTGTIPVSQAFSIDQKVDDGMPFTGNVTTIHLNGGPIYSAHTTGNGSVTMCSDNPYNVSGGQLYAVDQANGGYANCALSFKMQ